MTVNWRRETNSRLKSSQTEHSRVRKIKMQKKTLVCFFFFFVTGTGENTKYD